MSKNKSLSLSLFILLSLIFSAQIAFAKDTWTRVKSKNFHLIGNASEKDIRKVATKLEQFRETFRLILKSANFDSAIPNNVIVFKSGSSYKQFKPKRGDGKIDDGIAGYFQPGKDANYITLSIEGEDSETFGTIFHEYVHFMVDLNLGKSEVPPWFNEGLAEYYQTFEIENDQKVKLGLPQNGHLRLLQDNKLIPLETMLKIDNYSLHQNGDHSRSIFYAQAWAFLHFLMQDSNGTRFAGVEKFLNASANSVPMEKAFKDAFNVTYAEMEKLLQKYISQSSYRYQTHTLEKKLNFDAEMQTSSLPDAEMNAYLGDLLFRIRREDDAEPFLQKALALEPNSSMANTTMGMVRFRQRKFDEAKTYLEKAIAGDVKNDQAYYNYAYLLSREGRDEFGYVSKFSPVVATKMRDALKKAITLNPSFTPSYELYAFVNLVNNEQLDDSIVMLKKALTYQPGDQQTILRIAEIMFRQEKADDAKILAEKISKTSDEPEIKARAENLLRNIQTMLDVKARNEQLRKEYEGNRNNAMRNTSPRILGRRPNTREKVLTPEEIAQAKAKERNLAINEAIKKPIAGEKQLIGKIIKITCPPKMVVYSVKTESGTISLFSKDFQSLTLVAFDSDAENAQVACNANFTKYNSVLTYKATTSTKSAFSGELTAIDFVPESFRFIDEKELAEAADTSQNEPEPEQIVRSFPSETTVENDSNNFEGQRKEAMLNAIRQALRQPQEGETRLEGTIEKIECDKNGMFFFMKTGTQTIKLKSTNALQIRGFTSDIEQVQFGCGLKGFDAPTIFIFKESVDKKTKSNGEIISIEVVPKSFKLD